MKRSPKLKVLGQADHATEDEIGGSRPQPTCLACGAPRQPNAKYCSTACKRADQQPPTITLADGRTWRPSAEPITWSRSTCVSGSEVTGDLESRRRGFLCGAVRCRHHLLATAAVDMPGRRWQPDQHPRGKLRPVWLAGEMPARGSCSLDVAQLLGPQSCAQIAPRLGITSKRRVEQVARRAIDKLEASGLDPKLVEAMRAALDREGNLSRAREGAW